jgi:hypothetical protein
MSSSLAESHFFNPVQNDDTSNNINNHVSNHSKSPTVRYSSTTNSNNSNVISPMATSMRPYTASSMNFSMSSLSLAPIEISDSNDITNDTLDDTITNTIKSPKSNKSSSTPTSSKKKKGLTENKSMFLGSGLGLKKDPVSSTTPKGSAKMILKKIMTDFEDGKYD